MKNYKKYFLIFLIAFLILFIFSYFLPLLSYQEARKAVIIKETYYGNFLIPTYNSEPYFTKPPLHTWVSLPFYALGHIFSSEVFLMRLVSFLSYTLTGFIIYKIQKKDLFKTLLSLFILFSSFRFLSFIYRIDVEPLFILFTTASFYFLMRFKETLENKYVYLFYLFFAFAFLTRGPLHLFLLPAFLINAFIFKDRTILKLLFFLKGWLIFILISFPWYIFGYLKFGAGVFQEFIYTDIFKRLAGSGKSDPFYYYFSALILNFLPWILLLLIKAKTLLKKDFSLFSAEPGFYFLVFFIPIFLLSFTGEKFDKYLLFLYPIVALFMSEILLWCYSKKFLLSLGAFLFILNLSAILLIQLNSLEDLNYKIDLIKINLPKKEKIIFYQEENPLFIYYLGRPVPVVKEESKFLKYLKSGYGAFTTEEIRNLIPYRVFPDPYKKGKIWYYYKLT